MNHRHTLALGLSLGLLWASPCAWAGAPQPSYGCRWIVDEVSPVALDQDRAALAFRFTSRQDLAATGLSVYADKVQGDAWLRVSLYDDHKGKPGKALGGTSTQAAQGWLTVPLQAVPLLQGQVAHVVVEPDLNLGGDHPVVKTGPAHHVQVAVTAPAWGMHALDQSDDPAALVQVDRGRGWRKVRGQAVFLVHAAADLSQGNPYVESGRLAVHGNDTPQHLEDDQWQAQVLHPPCAVTPKGLALRVKKAGNPKHPLRFQVLKHQYAAHKTFKLFEGIAAQPDQVGDTWRWLEVPFEKSGRVSLPPECSYIAFFSAAGGPSKDGGCHDCYLISTVGTGSGAAGLQELTFDQGAHRSRASSSINGSHWQDHFSQDAHVVLMADPCTDQAAAPGPGAIATPMPHWGASPW